jgi:uncharacterized membrane protein
MDGAFVNDYLPVIFRWIHVVAGVVWIGHLYFFNWVNAHVAKTYDADSKKKVIPELMPRALYWFRWGAAFTWITGILLAGMVYYMASGFMGPDEDKGMNIGRAAVITFIIGPVLYDLAWKYAFKGKEQIGAIVSFVVAAVFIWYFDHFLPGRAAFIHAGAMFGTIMAMNVWMRIWPAQRKIIAAVKAGTAPDAAIAAMAGLRSKHNVYLSVPLIFTMISNHSSLVTYAPTGKDLGYAVLIVIVAVSWGAVKLLYLKSAKAEPAKF